MKKLTKMILITIITSILIVSGTIVKASTQATITTNENRLQTTHDGTNTYTSWYSGEHSYSPTNPVMAIQYRVKISEGFITTNTYTIDFYYKPTPDAISVNNYYIKKEDQPNEEINCKEYVSSTGTYHYQCDFTPSVNYTSNDYLYVRIVFNPDYLTNIKAGILNVLISPSTNAVIQDSADQIINELSSTIEQTTQQTVNAIETMQETIIENQQICTYYDKNTIKIDNKYLNSSGGYYDINFMGVSDYIKIKNNKLNITEDYTVNDSAYFCYYTINKDLINCSKMNTFANNFNFPSNTYYIRVSINKTSNKPQFEICTNGNQAIIEEDHNYNADTNDLENKIEEEEDLQNDIFDNLDTSFMDNWEMNLTGETPNYIYQKMTLIYGINDKWIAFITTILGLGIIKLILNR